MLDSLAGRLGESHADAVSARENLALILWQRERMQMSSGGQEEGALGAVARRMVAVDKARDSLIRSTRTRGIGPTAHLRKKRCFPYLSTLLTRAVATAAMYLCRAVILVLLLSLLLYPFFYPSFPSFLCSSLLLLLVVPITLLLARHRESKGIATGPPHRLPDVMGSLCMGGSLHYRARLAAIEDDEVLELQMAVLQAREAAQGPEHLDTIFARANMAATLRQRGQLHEAAELLCSVYDAQLQVLGEGHPDTVRTRAELAVTLKQLSERP